MKLELYEFRLAGAILRGREEWDELQRELMAIDDQEIVREHQAICSRVNRAPAGGQTAINSRIRSRLEPLGWTPEPRLFTDADPNVRRWKMDFIKAKLGVEIAFNHSEAVPWNFTRLNLAGEATSVQRSSQIEVGVAVFATKGLKDWCKMDGSVGTFDLAINWLELMKPVMPIPIMVVGLDIDDWAPTTAFRGTRTRH